ncbi:DUF1684 domain-containing protein [Lacibacter luteus]|uniref:DUF1684 domain-containing protein n=1 Tax=Lacibacter luteus TaxID=2508719 RepID=A0A4Q1CLM2_9BACT|nr:DUF1684 domain-containing protein [Lacibacter luteus]RXK61903.1 DUF1684 domain-containing protein [Lacibacter luteus]
MKYLLLILFCIPIVTTAQTSYEDSVTVFLKKYVTDHEVVTGADKQKLKFFPVSKQYRITASFEKKENSAWFWMNTSGKEKKQYRVFGVLYFQLNDSLLTLQVYQSRNLLSSEKYKDYLFIPFTDKTSGIESYGGGRYIDLVLSDIVNKTYTIDFNKAYNPYCAYTTGYNCPIPPQENDLQVAIKAGEMNYGKH